MSGESPEIHTAWMGTELVRLADESAVSTGVLVTVTYAKARIREVFKAILRHDGQNDLVDLIDSGELVLDDIEVDRDGGQHFGYTAIFVNRIMSSGVCKKHVEESK